jgi:DNA-binding protein H-NS
MTKTLQIIKGINMISTLTDIDLSSKSIRELSELITCAQKILEEREKNQTTKVLEDFTTAVREMKIPYSLVMRHLRHSNAIYGPRNEHGVENPIYYNPDNPLEIYDGTGIKPKWMKDLESGYRNEEYYRLENKGFINPNI